MKASGTIKTLVQGVSTQHPKERIPGQVWTMSNFVPDPVEGAVKRPGVKHTKSVIEDLLADALVKWHTSSIQQGDFGIGTCGGNIVLRSLETGEAVPVVQDFTTIPYFVGGIVSSTNIGEYTLLAGTAIPESVTQSLPSIFTAAYEKNDYATTAAVNRVVIVEIRQGAYSGVYTIRNAAGSSLASYTVPDGSAGSHSVNVQPNYIAGQLRSTLEGQIGAQVGAGIIRAVHQQGASVAIFLDSSSVDTPAELFADDGYYNTRMVLTDRLSTNSNTLPLVGIQGHVVEVGDSKNNKGNYFLRFEHTQSIIGEETLSLESNKLRPGRWVETSRAYVNTGYAAGGILTETTLPTLLFIFQGVGYVGTGQFIATSILTATGVLLDPLEWSRRVAGDSDSSPDPLFVGSAIKWLGIFQDRLVIMSEQGVSMSRTGDYLNFYRASVIEDLADDPINLPSSFDTKDVLVGGALLDKNLIVIGTKTHYVIVGRTAATPTNAVLLKTSAFESAPNTPPVPFGNYVYFASASEVNSDVLAIQPSDTTDSTYAYPVSSHVDGFIPGDLVVLVASTKMNILLALSASGVLYGYRTVFNQSERVLSAWFDFTFPTHLTLSCVAVNNTKIRMLFSGQADGKLFTTVGELDLDRVGYTGVTSHKYLDFWQVGEVSELDASARAACVFSKQAPTAVAIDSNLQEGDPVQSGTALSDDFYVEFVGLRDTPYLTGVGYDYNLTPTIPLPRDAEGNVMSVGNLTVGNMKINYTVAAMFTIKVTDKYRSFEIEHSARQVDAPDSFTDEAYIRDGSATFPVGSSEPSCRVSFIGNDHYPLVLSSMSWVGQYYRGGVLM